MTFEIAQLADLHIGYRASQKENSQGINLRIADGMLALYNIITDVIDKKPDVVVICGDIFHYPHPNIREIIFVQNSLRRLWKAGIPVYALSGNHDTKDTKEDLSAAKVLDDPWRNIFSTAEPYEVYHIADGINLHMVSHHLYSMQAKTMDKVKPVEGEINIFATHGSLIDPLTHLAIRTGSPREIIIPDFLLNDNDWDYRLLGHIHERGFSGSKDGIHDNLKKKTYYNGSIIRRGFSDKDCELGRGWTMWNIEDDGTFVPTFYQVAQRPQYDFDIINASDMNSEDISDKIIDNLRSTQIDGNNFSPSSAPILRQRIANISPAKYQALDLKAITEQSRHAMTWSIKQLSIDSKKDNSNDIKFDDNNSSDKNILQAYDSWVKGSSTLKEVNDKSMRKNVEEQTRKFIELGQEVVMEQE